MTIRIQKDHIALLINQRIRTKIGKERLEESPNMDKLEAIEKTCQEGSFAPEETGIKITGIADLRVKILKKKEREADKEWNEGTEEIGMIEVKGGKDSIEKKEEKEKKERKEEKEGSEGIEGIEESEGIEEREEKEEKGEKGGIEGIETIEVIEEKEENR
jgi:hypothetical protein